MLSGLAVSAAFCSLSLGQITGTVKLDGKAPEMKPIDMSGVAECAAKHEKPVNDQTVVANDKGGLQFVVVSLKPAEGQDLGEGAKKKAATLDQEGCQYHPHVLAMQAGATLNIKNSDEFLHNVHSLAEKNPAFNFAQANKGSKPVRDIKDPEVFHVKCDVHPWMSAYIAVFEHPYFAVTDKDGNFSIDTKGLKDGDYDITAWQEKYDKQEGKVTVKDGKGKVDFTYKAEAASADPIRHEVKLTDLVKVREAEGKSCCDGRETKGTGAQAKAD
jgi:plastocyanin